MAITFGDFLSIFTTNDPSGGRAIKATFDNGVDDIQNYLTKNDPAGGRAIKIVNVGAPLGPQFWTEAYSATTQASSSWTPVGAATNINAAIRPKGTGAIVAAIPDGTATGGNARGANAVDLQITRTANTQVAGGNNSVISGGGNNSVSQLFGAVLGGSGNNVSLLTGAFNPGSSYSVIGGGLSNVNGSSYSFIGGGRSNSLGDASYERLYSVIGGGFTNSSSASYTHIGGGANNSIVYGADYSNISGGSANTINNSRAFSTIGGGASNSISSNGEYIGIGGGRQNTASANYATVGGGQINTASGQYAFVGGGIQNVAGFIYDTVCGGELNSVTGANNSSNRFIGGGQRNTINAEQTIVATICGGQGNTIYGGSAGGFIGGGGRAAFPGGNFLTGTNSVIVGGEANRIGNLSNNPAAYSFIGGGGANIIDTNAEYSTIAGGRSNTINNGVTYASIIGGLQAVAASYGQVAHASGQFSAAGDAQAHELIWRREVTGTTATELFLDGASLRAILPGTNAIWIGIIDVVAVCTSAGNGTTVVGHVAATSYKVTIKRIGTTTSLVGGVQEIGTTNADASMATSAFAIDNDDTNEALRIRFGAPSTAGSTSVIRAMATFRGTQIKY
jgi:hypothetical protein